MEFELFIEILTIKFTLRHSVSYRTESIHFFSIHHRSISRGQTTMRPLWCTDHNNRLLTQDHIVFTSLYEPLSMAVAGCVFTIRKKYLWENKYLTVICTTSIKRRQGVLKCLFLQHTIE